MPGEGGKTALYLPIEEKKRQVEKEVKGGGGERKEGEGDANEGTARGPWQTQSPSRDLAWPDNRDTDTVRLLEGEA